MKRNSGITIVGLLTVLLIVSVVGFAGWIIFNPMEYIYRFRDGLAKDDAGQLIKLVFKYREKNNYYPWQVSPEDINSYQPWQIINEEWLDSGQSTKVLSKVGFGNEKTIGLFDVAFSKIGIPPTDFYVFNRGDEDDFSHVCFAPLSGKLAGEALEKCGISGEMLPSDLDAIENTVCAEDEVYYCLP